MVAYACGGGALECADTVLKVPTFHQAIKEFRQRVRRIVGLAFPPAYQSCFSAYGISFVRLNCLGVCTLLPGIQGKLCMSTNLRDRIQHMIVSITHNLKQRKADAVMQGEARVYPSRFPLRRRTDLFHAAPYFTSGVPSTDSVGINHGRQGPLSRPLSFIIHCPHCGTSVDASNRKLYGSSGWISMPCPRCGKSTSSRAWKCSCEKTWTTCPTHQPHGYSCIGCARVKSFQRPAVSPVARARPPRFARRHRPKRKPSSV